MPAIETSIGDRTNGTAWRRMEILSALAREQSYVE